MSVHDTSLGARGDALLIHFCAVARCLVCHEVVIFVHLVVRHCAVRDASFMEKWLVMVYLEG